MVKARKQHHCTICRKPIRPGEKYHRISGKWDGEFSALKEHTRCHRINRALWSEYNQDMCYVDPHGAAQEEASERGWRGLLKMVRASMRPRPHTP